MYFSAYPLRHWVSCFVVVMMFGAEAFAQSLPASDSRPPRDEADLRYWLWNMGRHHFSDDEMAAATGLSPAAIRAAIKVFASSPTSKPQADSKVISILPYPGGRHPRIGFLDGAIRPQRETKFSVFMPWDPGSYIVVDVPEAIWWESDLLYLAHTHIPTYWSKQHIELEKLEWNRHADGSLDIERRLPNGVLFGTKVVPSADCVRMELWLTNNSDRPLKNLRPQACIMTKAAPGFDQQTEANKVQAKPFIACRSTDGKHWIITAWENCNRTWANPACPCFHSDPNFPDCLPGQTQRVHGWLSFYTGTDIQSEFRRIASVSGLKLKAPSSGPSQ